MTGASPDGGTRVFRATLAGTDDSFEVPAGERILSAARRAGHWLPFECGWGSCGTCKATLVDGSVELLFPDAPAVDARDDRRRRVLLCQCTATDDITVKALRVDVEPPVDRPTRDLVGTLTEVEPLGPDISRFRFSLRDSTGAAARAAYRAGQYAILELEPGLRRCYSMAGLPGDGHVDFIAKRYPGRPGSESLHGMAIGEAIPVELPYGAMWLRAREYPLLFVAGGTGISAILALVRELAARDVPAPRVDIVYGAATLPELVCWDALVPLVERIPGARLHGVVAAPTPGWDGATGLVTDVLERLLPAGTDGDAPDVYLAGPPPMVRAVEGLLDTRRHQRDRRFVDSFG